MAKLNADQMKIAHLVLLQSDKGEQRKLEPEDLAVALPIYKKMKPFITKTMKEVGSGQVLTMYQYTEGEVKFDETEVTYLKDQLKRPFDIETAEIAEELNELLSK